MRYGLFLLLSLFMWQACDVEDKGNYDYDYQNASGELHPALKILIQLSKVYAPWRNLSIPLFARKTYRT